MNTWLGPAKYQIHFSICCFWPKQQHHKTSFYDMGCQRGGFVARRMILIALWRIFDTISYTVSNYAWQWQIAMGAWPMYYVWPMPSLIIFESSDNQTSEVWSFAGDVHLGYSHSLEFKDFTNFKWIKLSQYSPYLYNSFCILFWISLMW